MRRPVSKYTGLAFRYLLKQRRRTILSVLAVVLSVSLVTAAGILGKSISRLGLVNVRQRFGNFYVSIEGAGEDAVRMAAQHAMVDQWGSNITVGVVRLGGELVAAVQAPDAAWASALNVDIVEGRFPDKPGEVAVERWFYAAARVPVAIGDTITVEITPAKANQAGNRLVDEEIRRSCTIVGFLRPNPPAMNQGVASLLMSREESLSLLDGPVRYALGFTTRRELSIQPAIDAVIRSLEVSTDQVRKNNALLAALGQSASNSSHRAIRRVEIIVTAVILLATVAVIYNAFAVSVMERIRQFGILRTVGATPRQIRRLVLREAALVSFTGAPLGLGAGMLAVQVIILVFNGLSGDVGLAGITMTYPVGVLLGGPLLGVASVVVSGALPAIRAGRVSPLEAVLSEGRFIKDRIRRRRPGMIARLFGVSGRMAVQNLNRNPGRLAVTVLSVGIGITLFITFSGFLQTIQYAEASFDRDPLQREISVQALGRAENSISRREREVIEGLPGVAKTIGTVEVVGYIVVPPDKVDEVPAELAADDPQLVRKLTKAEGSVIQMGLMGLDDPGLEALRPHVTEGFRSQSELEEMNGVYLPAGVFRIGDVLPIVVDDSLIELTVAGYLDNLPPALTTDSPFVFPVAEATARKYNPVTGYKSLMVEVDSSVVADDVYRSIQAVTDSRDDIRVLDLTEYQESRRAVQLQISVLLYGLVVVVSLIGMLNIINTITTNLILRVREFGTLRAVGMSFLQMSGMVYIEASLYGIYSIIAGGAVGVWLTWLISRSVNQVQDIPWQFPWMSLLMATLGAVTLGLMSTVAPMRRIVRMNIVESIRATE